MNPNEAECHGYFLYGSGRMYEQDEATAKLTGQPQSFCNTVCPRSKTCWDEHKARVQSEHPEEVEKWDKLRAEAKRRGVPENLLAHRLMHDGKPPPYHKYMLPNFRLGRLHGSVSEQAGTSRG